MLGAIHNTFYIQEYIEKGDYDVRAFVVNGDPICAITRKSAHWITNTARGGAASNLPLNDEISSVLRSVHKAIGGEFLAVDLFRKEGNGWSMRSTTAESSEIPSNPQEQTYLRQW
jgi:Glutathione synthase/Ribosomal protein S6 modification enzyme (glutaminyl transferase)